VGWMCGVDVWSGLCGADQRTLLDSCTRDRIAVP